MKVEKTLAMLQEVRKNTTDPAMQKDLDAKIDKLKNQITVDK